MFEFITNTNKFMDQTCESVSRLKKERGGGMSSNDINEIINLLSSHVDMYAIAVTYKTCNMLAFALYIHQLSGYIDLTTYYKKMMIKLSKNFYMESVIEKVTHYPTTALTYECLIKNQQKIEIKESDKEEKYEYGFDKIDDYLKIQISDYLKKYNYSEDCLKNYTDFIIKISFFPSDMSINVLEAFGGTPSSTNEAFGGTPSSTNEAFEGTPSSTSEAFEGTPSSTSEALLNPKIINQKDRKIIVECMNYIKEMVHDSTTGHCRKNIIQFMCSLDHIGAITEGGLMTVFITMLDKAMDIDYSNLLFDMKNTSELYNIMSKQMIQIINDRERYFQEEIIKIQNNKEQSRSEMDEATT
jgi:hypothetical protein